MPRRKPSGPPLSGKASGRGARHPGAGGELRIIGGDWRSRKLRFPDAGGVRPSPARTRETLFNWLAYHLPGRDCLDLFSGSGALGLEALSRGAARTTFVDNNAALVQALRTNLRLLGSSAGTVECASAEAYLSRPPQQPFNIVFMDPPFRQNWLPTLLPLLDSNGWIKPGGWVYLEREADRQAPDVPASWHLHREKTAGQVTYSLYRTAVLSGDTP